MYFALVNNVLAGLDALVSKRLILKGSSSEVSPVSTYWLTNSAVTGLQIIPTWSCPDAILTPFHSGIGPSIGMPSGDPGLTPAFAETNSASVKVGNIILAADTIWEIASPVIV